MRPSLWLPALAGLVGLASAEDGLDGWLRYARLPKCHTKGLLDSFPSSIVTLDARKGYPVETAGTELQKGISGILGLDLDLLDSLPSSSRSDSPRIIVSTVEAYAAAGGSVPSDAEDLIDDGFYISAHHDGEDVLLLGSNERAALYAAFEYLSTLSQASFKPVAYATSPDAPIRWANQWDNLWQNGTHGSVERGYGGVSIFFDGVGFVREDLSRVPLYGRLLSSVRVNALVINNVNADPGIFSTRNLDGVEAIADLLRPWGVQLGLSLNFASPKTFGGLDTFDPLDEGVVTWWEDITDELYRRVPDMAGYLVKANSEGQPGPQEYNRTLAQGANLFAKALKPHGGLVLFRAFVYDHHADWNDWYADRANDAVKYFVDEDGHFDDNVVIQIKYGPIDFQVREPPSPLFSTLRDTPVAIELQVSQEYLGHQCHVVYLPPLWQTILGFDMRVDGKESPVRDILNGKVFGHKLGGYTSVMNVGTNATWLGSHLSMSNLYAFGRLAWEPTLDSVDILEDWTRLTFGLSRTVREAVTELSMASWPTYENYTGNLGVQTLVDILYTHYGPNPASMDHNGWGQWTRANTQSIGMDRTVWNGTGNAGQYHDEVASLFEDPETTPDDLMLWFHHVPYEFRLHSGKTVVQHFYDAHYDGAERAATFPDLWRKLKGKIDDERWEHQMFRLEYQAGHAIVWRDAINEFYRNLSGIPDEAGRVRNHPWRIEAEKMTLDGYAPVSVFPTETASQYTAIVTNSTGTASTKLDHIDSGTYNLAVNYYDITGGNSTWEISLNDETVGVWAGDVEYKLGKFPSTMLDGHSAIRITFWDVDIEKGDTLTVKGTANGAEKAPLDYISILPIGEVD